MQEIKISNQKKAFELSRETVAHINPAECVNCGVCRESCPVEAIHEVQREICRACPNCTDRPAQTFKTMHAFTTKQSCTTACPLGISPQGYVNLIKAGKKDKAYEIIWTKNPLPSVCAMICHHPCEQACKRGVLVDEPISIRGLKRFLSENVDYKPEQYPRLYDENIAIIGAGPAGIAAGHYLASAGYEVTIFEGSGEAGGMLKKGIPEFRLDRKAVDKDIEKLVEAGLDIRYNTKVSKGMIEKLKKEYDIVLIATGLPYSKELMIPGYRYDGVMTALNFMGSVNHKEYVKSNPQQVFDLNGEVVVIGCGSVAVDTARAALRCGASKVTMACLERGDDIPAHKWELEEAMAEGIELVEGVSPVEFAGQYMTLQGVTFAKVTEFRKDENNKLIVKTDDSQLTTLKADWAIVAIGQYADDYSTFADDDQIFFAGDVSGNGTCSVIDAMSDARKIAYEIDAKLQGRQVKEMGMEHSIEAAPIEEKIYPFNRRRVARNDIPELSVSDRITNFEVVEQSITEEQALLETQRCLQCGYEMVDTEKCIGCGICQKLCTKGNVITMQAANR